MLKLARVGWEGRLSPAMRAVHPAGERLFDDFAGQTVECRIRREAVTAPPPSWHDRHEDAE